ncbi:MFS transporter [Erwiniaceae bacterium BAC15a-03b]|uniref:MFS transporter n=1 Tax=Winslowiella arboricola TaxID=2978220 RepID=A0A9J6PSP3_9GAMM|nr:MFS transporter [Winslowiella arboricola]MCU5772759.1 MFS transporter [Winslowiella arboricola]MCU5777063.1 MFS transporter [Winslowiella arboricola]
MRAEWRAKAAVIIAVTIFGLTYGLSAPLIALTLDSRGYSENFIGINAAMHALGVLLIAPALPWLCRTFSTRQLMFSALLAAGVLLMLFPGLPVASWFLLRLLLGVATEVILVVTETWLNQVTLEQHRAKNLALYTAMLSLGFAAGPLLLSLHGSGSTAFMLGGVIALAAAGAMLLAQTGAIAAEQEIKRSLRSWLQMLPLALSATVLNAALECAGMNLLPLYAINLGWREADATSLIAILLLGAIVLQLPIGWLADRVDRRRLIVILAALSTLGALIWPLALRELWLARTLLFLWGGVFVGIYTVIITLTGQRFRGAELAGAYAILSVGWGIGALLGPTLGGIAMSLTLHGLPLMAALFCALFTLFALRATRTI